jgi:membrane protein
VPPTTERSRATEDVTRTLSHGWWDILKHAVTKGLDDEVGLMAGGVAFFAILALAPALIAAVALFGLVTGPSQTAAVGGWLSDVLPETARPLVLQQLQTVTSGGTGSLTTACVVAAGTALWSASSAIQKLLTSIQSIYERPETRGITRLYPLAVALALGAGVFIVVAVALLVGMPVVAGHLGTGARLLAEVVRWVVLLVLVVVALGIVYRVAPDRPGPPVRWISLGSVSAAVVWLVGSVLFSIYVDHFSSYNQTYGALAGVVVLMLWLYLTAYVVLMGAEVNVEAERRAARD